MRPMTKLLSPNPIQQSLHRHSGRVYSSFLKTKVPQMSVCCDTDLQCCAHGSCLSGPLGAWRRSPGPETRRCRREAARDCAHVSRQRPGLIPPHPWSQTLQPLQPDRGFGVHLQGRGSGEKRKRRFKITCLLTLLSSITDPGGISWEAADIQMNTKQILLFDKVGYARQTDVTWLFAASWTLLCLKRFQTVTVNTGRHIHTYSMSICSICSILRSLTLKTDHYKHRAQQDNNHKLMLKPALTQHCCTSWTGQQGSKLLCRLSKLKSWHQHWSNI